MKNKPILITGYILIIMYILQYILNVNWEIINKLQGDNVYKKWSGFILLLFILFQWVLTFIRAIFKPSNQKKHLFLELHKWIGAISPLIFYLHSVKPGHALLLFLTIIFFTNSIIGLLNAKNDLLKKKWVYNVYLSSHIILSISVLTLSIIHIWVVFKFN